ncbi:MAG: gliding motility-associated C-terminal domain-containing protein, partial [Sphingobacteriia bacterium]
GNDPSTHTDMTSPYTGAVTVSATGNYTRYLRAHNGTCWSAGFGLVSFTINPIPAVPGALSEVNVGCEATNLQATGIPAPGVSWYWQDAENGIDRSVPYAGARAVTAGGTYYLRAEQNGCWSTASNITVTRESGTASFQVRLGRLSLPAEKQVTILNQSQVPAGSSYSWEFPGGTPASYVGEQPVPITYSRSGRYTLRLNILSPDGCTYTAEQRVEVTQSILLPNAFSPNADGTNDTWPGLLETTIDPQTRVKIFDRWGTLMYEGFPVWDGKDAPEGVYYYSWEGPGGDSRQGTITLVR